MSNKGKNDTKEMINKKTPIEYFDLSFKFMPFILILPQIAGGMVGGVCGALGWAINEKVFKTDLGRILKYAISVAITVICFVLYILVASFILGLL